MQSDIGFEDPNYVPPIKLSTDPSNFSDYFSEEEYKSSDSIIRWFKFTLKPPYSIARGKLRLAIWDTSFSTFWLKFGHKGP